MILHCYGHYGIAYDLAFNNTYWAALENGWSLAYAHIRGGGEKGHSWHTAAIKSNKYKNWTDL
jgi:protease II